MLLLARLTGSVAGVFLFTMVLGAGVSTAEKTEQDAKSAEDRQVIEFKRPEAVPSGVPDPKVGRGTAVRDPAKEWPATFAMYMGKTGICTATAIGPRVIVTAAHCIDDGADALFRNDGARIWITCNHHPDYGSLAAHSHDFALCKSDGRIPLPAGESYEVVSLDTAVPKVKDKLTLLGYGCTELGGPVQHHLWIGTTTIESVGTPSTLFVASDGAVLCEGDSGGAAYSTPGLGRRVLGVNSLRFGFEKSGLTYLAADSIASFVRDWSTQNDVKICGNNWTSPDCRK